MSQNAPRNAADVAVLVGSLRKESFNRKMARAAIELAPPSLKLEIVEIGHLPFYNQDQEDRPAAGAVGGVPAAAEGSRGGAVRDPGVQPIGAGVLKNAIDVASRPRESSAWRASRRR
jgi:chromate reductase